MQTCTYCDEQIQDAAIVCRFCNRNQPLRGNDSTQSTTNLSPYEQQQQATRQQPPSPLYDRRLHKALLGVAAVIVLLWLLPSAPSRRADVAATPDTREIASSYARMGSSPALNSGMPGPSLWIAASSVVITARSSSHLALSRTG
jgi:hypothetical protein